MEKKLNRILIRIDILLKIQDTTVAETYYVGKVSRIWNDLIFLSVGWDAEANQTYVVNEDEKTHEFAIPESTRNKIDAFLEIKEGDLRVRKDEVRRKVAKELRAELGLLEFEGHLLESHVDYVALSSKQEHGVTYYRHYFYSVTSAQGLDEIVGIRSIELIPFRLFESVQTDPGALHRKYKLGSSLRHFCRQQLWLSETSQPLEVNLVGESDVIGIFFSDIKGFGDLVKSFAEDHESSQTRLMIKRYQYFASLAIKKQGGYVVQTAGDAFMAIFNIDRSPSGHMSGILRILRAAVGVMSIDESMVNSPKPLITRIGANLADVREGFVGALDLREYTVLGKGVNIASRLEKKVEEIPVKPKNFAGGVLLNINGAMLEKGALDLASNAGSKSQDADNELLEDFQKIIAQVKNELAPYQTENYGFAILEELLSLEVKEGNTLCIFVYKYAKT